MFKKLIFLSLIFAIAPILAMEEEMVVTKPAIIAEWAKNASHVHIESLKLNVDFNIKDDTTILDIKNMLVDCEGIPTDQQKLLPLWKILWIKKPYNVFLNDDRNIKEIMSTYNTFNLALYLTLKPVKTENKN